MKETRFIRQNIEKWNTYEEELKKKSNDPSKISRLFIQVTDDLAFAQTFYKNRSVRVYLNGIAQLLFNDVNRTNKFKTSSFFEFWKTDLPVIMYKVRYELLFSFLIFMVSVAIGIITSVYEPEFAQTILGSDYVEMTKTNIQNNDPMAVYKSQNGFDMFLGITINNIRVAFITFLLGIFFGFGTFMSLLRNGIMLGTFQYFFVERDLMRESFLTIWQHGTLEISAIIIAGCAGFTIGRGLILPGTYTRLQSLRLSARRGIKIMLGLVPVFVFAAFIEGFFTRHTDVPDVLRLSVILISLTFILFYFVFYPIRVARQYPEKTEVDDKLDETDDHIPDLTKILSSEMLFGGTLKILKLCFYHLGKKLAAIILLASLAITLFPRLYQIGPDTSILYLPSALTFFIDHSHSFTLFVTNIIVFSLIIYFGLGSFNAIMHKNNSLLKKNKKLQFINAFIIGLLTALLFFLPTGWSILLLLGTLPFLILTAKTGQNLDYYLAGGIRKAASLLKSDFGNFLLLNLKFLILGIILLILLSPGVFGQLLQFIKWNLWIEEKYVNMVFNFVTSFLFYLSISVCASMLIMANALYFYSLREKKTASNLLAQIEKIGTKKSIRGYEVEHS